MGIKEFLIALREKPLFYIISGSDSELRQVYIDRFIEAHQGKPIYTESPQIGKQPRIIGKKPVYIIQDWESGLKKPKSEYMKVTFPTLLVYSKGELPESVKSVYKDKILLLEDVTGEQVSNRLKKIDLPDSVIKVLKEKTSGTQEALLLGKQVVSLSKDLGIDKQECFDVYFKQALKDRNLDEEPTQFLESLLSKDFNYVFQYLYENIGNELFVFGCLLNWLEDIIRYCSCKPGDYWEDGGLVSAKITPFKNSSVKKIPFLVWIRLYELGLHLMQSIKINEPDANSCLGVFVCRIIQTLG